MGQVTNKPIRTTRIEVVDEHGRIRLVLGYLGAGQDGVFGVAVRDDNGRDRAWLLHDGPAAEVGLDFGGDTIAALTVGADGVAELQLHED